MSIKRKIYIFKNIPHQSDFLCRKRLSQPHSGGGSKRRAAAFCAGDESAILEKVEAKSPALTSSQCSTEGGQTTDEMFYFCRQNQPALMWQLSKHRRRHHHPCVQISSTLTSQPRPNPVLLISFLRASRMRCHGRLQACDSIAMFRKMKFGSFLHQIVETFEMILRLKGRGLFLVKICRDYSDVALGGSVV